MEVDRAKRHLHNSREGSSHASFMPYRKLGKAWKLGGLRIAWREAEGGGAHVLAPSNGSHGSAAGCDMYE